MDRLFRQSGLMREKWDSRRGPTTFGEREIARAIIGCTETYGGGDDVILPDDSETAAPPTSADPVPDATDRRVTTWPDSPDPIVYRTWLGAYAKAVEPHSEADPTAILVQTLALFGNAIGPTPHFCVGADIHKLKVNVVIVGPTSSGRKGMSGAEALRPLALADPDWANSRIQTGLSSGEGLIWAVRDPIQRTCPTKDKGHVTGYETVIEDHGVSDKRLMVIETEFASTLRVIQRDGSTLSPVIRQAWDGSNLRLITKNSPAQATGAHITVIGTIAFDPAFASDVSQRLSASFSMLEVPQNFNYMSVPSYTFEGLLKARRVHHAGHPILTWNIANVEVKRDEAGRLRPTKPKTAGGYRKRIDGVTAALTALAVLARRPPVQPAAEPFLWISATRTT
jgi:hypothetical protein